MNGYGEPKHGEASSSAAIRTRLQGENVCLRSVTPEDYQQLYALEYESPDRQWADWDAPYFKAEEKQESFEEFVQGYERLRARELSWEPRLLVETSEGQMLGIVSAYWEHEASNWLEAGIVLFGSRTWSRGSGTEALKLYVGYLFSRLNIPRVGITTWSGNERMMRAAARIGMQLEGRMRNCRIVNGQLYDSIRMGVLREEWEALYGPIQAD